MENEVSILGFGGALLRKYVMCGESVAAEIRQRIEQEYTQNPQDPQVAYFYSIFKRFL
jgi:hypothetical protein